MWGRRSARPSRGLGSVLVTAVRFAIKGVARIAPIFLLALVLAHGANWAQSSPPAAQQPAESPAQFGTSDFRSHHSLSWFAHRSDRVAGRFAGRCGCAAGSHAAQDRRTSHARSPARRHAGPFCHRTLLRHSGRSGSHRHRRRAPAFSDRCQFFRGHGGDRRRLHQSVRATNWPARPACNSANFTRRRNSTALSQASNE